MEKQSVTHIGNHFEWMTPHYFNLINIEGQAEKNLLNYMYGIIVFLPGQWNFTSRIHAYAKRPWRCARL